MSAQVFHVGVFGLILTVRGETDEIVDPVDVRVFSNHRAELLSME